MVCFDWRFETLEPEMNTLGARISDVNQVAQQLLGSDNRNKEQIDQTQNQLNNRYSHQHKEQIDHTQSYLVI